MSYQVAFALNFYLCVILMKLINWTQCRKDLRPGFISFHFGSPLLSAKSFLNHSEKNESFTFLFIRFFISFLFTILIINLIKLIFTPLSNGEIILICPVVYFLTETLSTFAQLLFYSVNCPRNMHVNPLASTTLGIFWGRRWNIWVQDWLRDFTQPFRKNLTHKLVMTFLISGLFHEIMVNLPYYVFFKKSYFGNMTLYFFIQGLGLWFEKKWLRCSSPVLRKVYLWMVVALPSPLFINVPLLTFLGIVNE